MSPLTHLAKILEAFPGFLFSFAFSLLATALSDSVIFALVLGCIALGFVVGAVWAVAAFFLLYVQVRTFNSIANAVGNGLVNHAGAVASLKPGLGDPPVTPAMTP